MGKISAICFLSCAILSAKSLVPQPPWILRAIHVTNGKPTTYEWRNGGDSASLELVRDISGNVTELVHITTDDYERYIDRITGPADIRDTVQEIQKTIYARLSVSQGATARPVMPRLKRVELDTKGNPSLYVFEGETSGYERTVRIEQGRDGKVASVRSGGIIERGYDRSERPVSDYLARKLCVQMALLH